MKSLFLLLSLALILHSFSYGDILEVPEGYSSIQQGINAAANGDTVLVAPGIYYENINFWGKNIVVSSHFIIDKDVNFIKTTIINGSQPSHPDTASCVLIVSGENSTAVLQGFTLTGGTGTKWIDEHGAGTYTEGGGILITLASPTIMNNLIIDNKALKVGTGITSAGGGGIRVGDGSPTIVNNVIMRNDGMYGGGIVLNYCSNTLISNNIIANNRVYKAGASTFGGGGVWILETIPGNIQPNIVINNTIVSNSANDIGGGIRIWSANVTMMNNIVWNNTQGSGNQINITSATPILEYNNVEDEVDGKGNFSLHPSFADSGFYLLDDSPCIDAGNPENQFNDPEDQSSPGNALWPAKGTIINDIGAYGGYLSDETMSFSSAVLFIPETEYDFGFTLPGDPKEIMISISNNGASSLSIVNATVLGSTDIDIHEVFPLNIAPLEKLDLVLTWTPQINAILLDTLLIEHDDSNQTNPLKIILKGNSFPNAFLEFDTERINYGDISVSVEKVDTTLYVYNRGTAPDSVYTSLIYDRVTPDSALGLNPVAFELAPGDSAGITITFYPSIIPRTGFDIYQPRIIVDSRFSIGALHFEKTIRFRLVRSVDVKTKDENPAVFNLLQNYPNPFNPVTTIRYIVPHYSFVSVKVYDILGNEISTLVNQELNEGEYEVLFDGNNFSSGIYFYRIKAENFQKTLSMILIK